MKHRYRIVDWIGTGTGEDPYRPDVVQSEGFVVCASNGNVCLVMQKVADNAPVTVGLGIIGEKLAGTNDIDAVQISGAVRVAVRNFIQNKGFSQVLSRFDNEVTTRRQLFELMVEHIGQNEISKKLIFEGFDLG